MTASKSLRKRHPAATRQEVGDLLAATDPETISRVTSLRATREEIIQACKWAADAEYMKSTGLSLTPAARRVYELLAEGGKASY
jgi:hypothetical protein